MTFCCHSDRIMIKNELFLSAESLYRSNPELFNTETFELLNDSIPFLENEDYQVKMECAQIWHKNIIDIWIFRLRYYLNIATSIDDELLMQKIKYAYTARNEDFIKRFDARTGYDNLFYSMFRSNDAQNQNLRRALENIITLDLAQDVDGVVAYVMIKEALNEKKDIPSYMETIFTAVTNLSLIENGGLCTWLLENNISTLKKTYTALKKIGMKEVSEVLQEVCIFLKENADVCQVVQITDPTILCQIEEYGKRLKKVYSNKVLFDSIEAYFLTNK